MRPTRDPLHEALIDLERSAPTEPPPPLPGHQNRHMTWALRAMTAAGALLLGVIFVNAIPGGRDAGEASPRPTIAAIASSPGEQSPTPAPTASPTPPPIPPLVGINGSRGALVSWCWDGTCAEETLDFEHPDRYPEWPYALDTDAAVTLLEAEAYASADEWIDLGDVRRESSGYVFNFNPVDDWRIVVVHAVFEGGGEASYAWQVVRHIQVGIGADRTVIEEPLQEVRPPTGPHDAEVSVTYDCCEGVHIVGIEGHIYFLKATDARGTVVLDRMMNGNGDMERIPPGDYVLSTYFRTCDANCFNLDPPHELCSVEATLEPNDRLHLAVTVVEQITGDEVVHLGDCQIS